MAMLINYTFFIIFTFSSHTEYVKRERIVLFSILNYAYGYFSGYIYVRVCNATSRFFFHRENKSVTKFIRKRQILCTELAYNIKQELDSTLVFFSMIYRR